MDQCNAEITTTPEQLVILNGPATLDSLKVADFLGKQDYINSWIEHWLVRYDIAPTGLPLCVENTFFCYKKMFRLYTRSIIKAVTHNDINWMRTHYIVPFERIWKYVDYQVVLTSIFELICQYKFPPYSDMSFVCQSVSLGIWKPFVDHYGATECLDTALKQRYSEGVIYCIDEGANLDNPQILKLALRLDAITLTHLLMFNPPVSEAAYEEYLLWKSIGAVPDVVRLEEYFWINGFKGKVT
jgi:hypothetical protein